MNKYRQTLGGRVQGVRARNRRLSLLPWFSTSILASILCLLVVAQYAIDWFTIDGGGGTSTGGVYTVSGTAGQADVGPTMAGGQYTVVGGFWSLVAVVETPGAPHLTVSLAATGMVTVSWPESAKGWVLQASPTLTQGGTWVGLPSPSPTNGFFSQLIEPVSGGSTFYRLHKP